MMKMIVMSFWEKLIMQEKNKRKKVSLQGIRHQQRRRSLLSRCKLTRYLKEIRVSLLLLINNNMFINLNNNHLNKHLVQPMFKRPKLPQSTRHPLKPLNNNLHNRCLCQLFNKHSPCKILWWVVCQINIWCQVDLHNSNNNNNNGLQNSNKLYSSKWCGNSRWFNSSNNN